MTIGNSRTLAKLTLVFAALAITACSDRITDPQGASSLRPDGPHLILGTTSLVTFTMDPTIDNIYQSIDGHRVVIPANAICKVGSSGYGSAYWNQSCATETNPITFTITTTTNTAGLSNMTVSPDVRFSPAKQVTVFFKDAAAATRAGSVITYCSLKNGLRACIDEGKHDPSLVTLRDPSLGYIYRRLKHFSGYNVTFGRACDPSDGDPDCVDDGAGITSISRPMPLDLYSGYITTVGRLDLNP